MCAMQQLKAREISLEVPATEQVSGAFYDRAGHHGNRISGM